MTSVCSTIGTKSLESTSGSGHSQSFVEVESLLAMASTGPPITTKMKSKFMTCRTPRKEDHLKKITKTTLWHRISKLKALRIATSNNQELKLEMHNFKQTWEHNSATASSSPLLNKIKTTEVPRLN